MMNKGFTLIELLVVIIIISILAAIAIPRYFRSVERSRQAEALNILGMVRMSEYRYQLENGVFTSDIDDLDFENPNSLPGRYFDYAMISASADTFSTKATRNSYRNFSGPNYIIELDQDGAFSSDF